MYIEDFIWLPEIVDKIDTKHSVLPEEAEEVSQKRNSIMNPDIEV